MYVPHAHDYVSSNELTVLSSPYIVWGIDLMQLDRVCIESSCTTIRSNIDQCRKFNLEEEDTRNRIIFEDLALLLGL